MKFLFGLMVALAFTIAWQTSVLSGQEGSHEQRQQVAQVHPHSGTSGKVDREDGDCD